MSTQIFNRATLALLSTTLPAVDVDWLGFDDSADPFPQMVDYADLSPRTQGGKIRIGIQVQGVGTIVSLVIKIAAPPNSLAPTLTIVKPINGGVALTTGIPVVLEDGLTGADLLSTNRSYAGGSISYNVRFTAGTLTAIDWLLLQELTD